MVNTVYITVLSSANSWDTPLLNVVCLFIQKFINIECVTCPNCPNFTLRFLSLQKYTCQVWGRSDEKLSRKQRHLLLLLVVYLQCSAACVKLKPSELLGQLDILAVDIFICRTATRDTITTTTTTKNLFVIVWHFWLSTCDTVDTFSIYLSSRTTVWR